MAQKPFIAPIPGTTKLHRLEENMKAADIVLTDDEVKALNFEISKIELVGARYPKALQERVGN